MPVMIRRIRCDRWCGHPAVRSLELRRRRRHDDDSRREHVVLLGDRDDVVVARRHPRATPPFGVRDRALGVADVLMVAYGLRTKSGRRCRSRRSSRWVRLSVAISLSSGIVIARSGQLASARRADISSCSGTFEQHDSIAVVVAAEHLRRGDCAHLVTMASFAINRHSHRFFLSGPATSAASPYGCDEPS